MSNMSEAFGTFKFIGPWTPKKMETFLNIVQAHRHATYGTYIADESYLDVGGLPKENEELQFTAYGRWTFRNNLETMYEFAERLMLTDIPDTRAVKRSLTLLLKHMHKYALRVQWNYVDLEVGCQVLGRFSGHHIVESVEGNLVFKYVEANSEMYDCTLKNQCELYGDEEYLDSVVSDLCRLYKIADGERVKDLIKTEPNWFGFTPYLFFESTKDVPELLDTALQLIAKEEPYEETIC